MKDLSNENVVHIKKGDVEYLQFRKLLEYSDILTHAYSLGIKENFRTKKLEGEMTEKEKEISKNSYQNLCNCISYDYEKLIKPNQCHTDNVQIVKEKINTGLPDFDVEQYNKTDGLITDKKDYLLATTNADCILLLFFDPVKKVIANTHSGWKGTLQRISVKTVEKMKKEFGCNPKDIICCMCPSIRKCHFEVDSEVKEQFEKEFLDLPQNCGIIEKNFQKEKWNIDTVLINKLILEKQGLIPENIVDSGLCSVCNSDIMHSFRAEGESYGLETAVLGLR